MHVLFIPRAYPNKLNYYSSIFFKEQAESLTEIEYLKIGVLSIVMVKMSQFIQYLSCSMQKQKVASVNVILHQRYILAIPKFWRLTLSFRILIGKILFQRYVSKQGKPDIIHLQTFEMGALGQWIKRKYNIPYVVTEHLSHFNVGLPKSRVDYAKKVFRDSSAIIAVSEDLKHKLKSFTFENINYIPNVVDTDFFKPVKANGSKNVRFVNIANCLPIKQQEMLIEAFNNGFSKSENARLTIVGNGPKLTHLKALVKSLNLTDKVHFTGSLTKEEIRGVLQDSDYFVLSSKSETFGVVLIEAMSMGIPVVSTKSGGPESIVKNVELGILCENNVESLQEAMQFVVNKEFNRRDIRNSTIENYSKQVFNKRLLSVYNQVLNSN